jgi:prepilin-type N-terminal cleavage/methylation domain-containing protein
MKIMNILKDHWFGRLLVVALCVFLLTSLTPIKANATLIELLVVIAIIGILIADEPPPPVNPDVWKILGNQLKASIDDAAAADSDGDLPKVIGSLGKAGGTAEAMMGVITPCASDKCNEIRGLLQQVIGIVAFNKSRIVGSSGHGCHIDGVVRGHEQCDPLAVPTGCPTLTIPTFCNENCQCQPVTN